MFEYAEKYTRQGRLKLSMASVLAASLLAASSGARAADFTPGIHGFLDIGGSFTQIDVPGSISGTAAFGINNAGQIVGDFSNNTGTHGFLYTSGSFTQIDAPGATSGTHAYGINSAGQIVGSFSNSTGNHGFLETGGSFTQIDVPGASLGFTFAYGINNAGQIVGNFESSTGNHGFLESGGSFTQIDVPGASLGTAAFGINNAGQIVGYFSNNTGTHGFLDTGGSFTQINVPGAGLTSANGINSAGQIVGNFYSTGKHGFLDTGGSFNQIDVPVPSTTVAYTFPQGINDLGQIVGHTFVAGVIGDPHFTTYNGVHYDYQGLGNFLLIGSTTPGNQFHVEIHTAPFSIVATTVITEAAATLCDHEVDFDVERASAGGSFFRLDGFSTSLNVGNPTLTVGTCKVVELSDNRYQLDWNTGEILNLTDEGTYLDLWSLLSWVELGSVQGMLASDLDPGAWRLTTATLLLAPVPEPTTLPIVASALVGLAMIRRCRNSRNHSR
jgi:probable HAF family extracellular repeat protein